MHIGLFHQLILGGIYVLYIAVFNMICEPSFQAESLDTRNRDEPLSKAGFNAEN